DPDGADRQPPSKPGSASGETRLRVGPDRMKDAPRAYHEKPAHALKPLLSRRSLDKLLGCPPPSCFRCRARQSNSESAGELQDGAVFRGEDSKERTTGMRSRR